MSMTDTQQEYVAWRADPQRKGTKAEWAAEHSVSTETLRRWEKTDWFKDAMDEQLHELHLSADATMEVVAAAHEKAKNGDTQAMKLYLAFLERVAPVRQRADDGDLAGLSTDELLAMLEGPID
jgi:primosomal protein N'